MNPDTTTRSEMLELARRVGVFAGVFAAGVLVSFVYSCGPLHNAKNWKIDYLEERLEARSGQVAELEEQVAGLQVESGDSAAAKELVKLREELAAKSKSADELESKLVASKKREKELASSRDSWKSRHAKVESQLESTASQLAAAAPSSRTADPSRSNEATPPASRGPADDASDSEVEVSLGEGWESEDGRARFELVALDKGSAKIIPDPGSLGPGEKPTVISVPEGGRFHVGRASGRPLQILLTRVNGAESIRVEITQ